MKAAKNRTGSHFVLADALRWTRTPNSILWVVGLHVYASVGGQYVESMEEAGWEVAVCGVDDESHVFVYSAKVNDPDLPKKFAAFNGAEHTVKFPRVG